MPQRKKICVSERRPSSPCLADCLKASRLHGVKASLVDLCDRQLNDLVDAGPSEQKDVEDIDNLLEEMRSVRRCMETVTAIERALNSS